MDKVDYSRPENILRPLKAIREKCRDCMADSAPEIRGCSIVGCSLWPYRMGHRPETGDGTASEMALESEKGPQACMFAETEAPGKGIVPPSPVAPVLELPTKPEGKVLKDIPRRPMRIESAGTSA